MFKNLDNSDKFLISYSNLFWGSLLLGHSVQHLLRRATTDTCCSKIGVPTPHICMASI